MFGLSESSVQRLIFVNLISTTAIASLHTKLANEGTGSLGLCAESVLDPQKQAEKYKYDDLGDSIPFLVGSKAILKEGERHLKIDGSDSEGMNTQKNCKTGPTPSEPKRWLSNQESSQVKDSGKKDRKRDNKKKNKDKEIMSGVITSSNDSSSLETDDFEKEKQDRALGENANLMVGLIANLPEEYFLSERQLEEERKTFYNSIIKAAFQPCKTEKKDEIFAGIVKPLFSHAVHTIECTKFREEILKSIKIENQKNSSSPNQISTSHVMLKKTLEILEPHLETFNPQEHLPLSEMDDETYRKLQLIWNLDPTSFFEIHQALSTKIERYELNRRLSTLANQIIQKTAVENWNLIYNSLCRKGKKKGPSVFFLNSLQKDFQLDCEFPDILEFFELWKGNEGILRQKIKHSQHDSGGIILEVIGFAEYRRRFEFELISFEFPHLVPRFTTKQDLPRNILEDLKRAEKSNGVNIWMVCCFIEFLGLEKKKKFTESEEKKLEYDFKGVLNLMDSNKYLYIPWYESPDRAWLTKNYKDYHQQLYTLCNEHQERKTYTKEFMNLKLKTGQTKYNTLTIETKLLFLDNGIPATACYLLHKMIFDLFVLQGNKKEDLNYRELPIIIDWSSFYEFLPWKFNCFSQKFIQNWFQFKN